MRENVVVQIRDAWSVLLSRMLIKGLDPQMTPN